MKELAIRLKYGDDLRKSIEDLTKSHNIDTAIVLSGVGCLSSLNIRLAKAIDYYQKQADYEIVSLTGTVSKGKAHIHISVSDELGNCIGGHLEQGCIINTTCELVLGILQEYSSNREYDEETGYDEIVFREVNHD